MFNVEIKFKAGDREVSLERFATLFLKKLLRSAQDEIRPQPIHERVKSSSDTSGSCGSAGERGQKRT